MNTQFTYEGKYTKEISFPLGGIGAGCIGLAGNGRLVDWEIFNRPNKGSLNGMSHFAIKAEADGQLIDARILHGDLYGDYIGERGPFDDFFSGYGWGPRRENLCGMPHFRKHRFIGSFPTARIEYEEPTMPGKIAMEAWSPFIPGRSKESSLPGSVFEIEIDNDTDQTLDYTVVCALSNPFGNGGTLHQYSETQGIHQLTFSNENIDKEDIDYGELCISTNADDISYQAFWYRGTWCDDLEIYWKELTEMPRFKNRVYEGGKQIGYTHCDTGHIAAHVTLEAGCSKKVQFVISWHVPNNHTYWRTSKEDMERVQAENLSDKWRNYYATQWSDARKSAQYLCKYIDEFREKTYAFRDVLLSSSLPKQALEAVSGNLSTLRTPVCLRLEDGTFYGWEGAGYKGGSCEGSCTHVWNYAQALPYLFPDLERSMRDANYHYSIDEHGGSQFRLRLPLGIKALPSDGRPCADGQFGDVMKTYRDWKISGDTTWLKGHWETIKKTIHYAWSDQNPDQWDPEMTGVLWGRQHHTLDMELFGPNAWLTGYYLGALKAAAEMAEALEDRDFYVLSHDLFSKGKWWVETHLFNGKYYHQLVDIKDKSILERYTEDEASDDPFHILNYYWDQEHGEIKYQVGEGCEIDMTIAQWHANMYGLGEIFNPDSVKTALAHTFKYNYFNSMRDLVNPWRNYAINDEAGLQIATWPEGRRKPCITLPYCQEDQGGYSYAAAIQMIQSGLIEEGMTVIKAQRDKYDGYKRNPWNEIECGSNYARSMATYSLLQTYSGFKYDMTKQFIGFYPLLEQENQQYLWSLEGSWGQVKMTASGMTILVVGGQLTLSKFGFQGADQTMSVSCDGQSIAFSKSKRYILFDQVQYIDSELVINLYNV